MTSEATNTGAKARACAIVAIIGAPNAGKSTLVNGLVGAKVSIVSHKVQTTRSRIRGIFIRGQAQIVLIDTPGIFRPRRRLDRAMVGAAWEGAKEADTTGLVIDAARGLVDEVRAIASGLSRAPGPRLAVLNKIDRVKKESLLQLAAEVNALADFSATFMISAENGHGLDRLAGHLEAQAPAGPWLYPEDEITDIPVRFAAAEITREKIYDRLHDELPYAASVETTDWKTLKDGSIRIEQTIYVERESQRRIFLGNGGDTIKRLSMEARADIVAMIEGPAHLFLFVKVRDNWGDDPERYRSMGLDYPKDSD